jgi:nucleoside-diphosphate-sugar epimerase
MVNALGTKKVLEAARRADARVVITSTSEVYGDPEIHPQPESYWGHVNPIGVRSCYDEGKRFSEALAVAHRRTYGIDVRIARVFNTYGPRMDPQDGRVISNFVVQGISGTPFTIYGRGRQTRSFCYSSDLVLGLYKLMKANRRVPTPMNLGNPRELSILDTARLVARALRIQPRFAFRPLPADDPKQRSPDIRLARKHLGWSPRVPLEEGLVPTVAYFRSRNPNSRRGK